LRLLTTANLALQTSRLEWIEKFCSGGGHVLLLRELASRTAFKQFFSSNFTYETAARDEILCQYERLNATSIDPNRLTSRRGKAASFLMEEGRIRKRYSAELPKIHARLIPMLEEYEETFGEPFLWDGKPLLDAVAEMHRREEASVIQARLKQQTKRASPGRSRPPRGANALSQRAPFQLQEFMF
jgi:protein regulator of cytokinesis 1